MAYGVPTMTKHAICFPSKIAAGGNGGPHIYDVTLSTAADNGNIIGRVMGAWTTGEFDNYAEAACPNGFAGKVVGKSARGYWYVEVTALPSAAEALLVYNSPIIPYESPRELADESNFYNAAGEVVKAYALSLGDIFEVSDEAFTGTPVVGKALSVASKKLVVAS